MIARHIPAVQFPVHRPPFLKPGLLLASAACVAWLVGWLWQESFHSPMWNWKLLLVICCLLCTAWAVWHAWFSMPIGELCWDGHSWVFVKDDQRMPISGGLQVILDMQSAVLLRCLSFEDRTMYFWVQRNWAGERWGDFRRAVYSLNHRM